MEPTNLQKAIAVANKAAQEDQAGNYEEAVKSYQHAVKYFLHIVKREPQGKEGNQKIRDKCKQYLDRAEELQDYLDKREVTIKLSLSLCVFMNTSKQFHFFFLFFCENFQLSDRSSWKIYNLQRS